MKQILSNNRCRSFLQISGIILLAVALLSQSATGQTQFKKFSGNPILTAGPAGSWDADGVTSGSVMYHNSKYHMWFPGVKGSVVSIGYAFSDDGIVWTKYSGNPVLTPGAIGAFDAELYGCYVLFYSGRFHMWYDGISSGNWKFGYAYSEDGMNWTKHSTYVFEPGSWEEIWDVQFGGIGTVIKEDTVLKMFYWGKSSTSSWMTCLAESPDSIHWGRHLRGHPVLAGGVSGAWDQSSQYPGTVLKNGGLYEMWYGNWTPSPYCIGYASSTNGGLNWTTYSANPVLRGDAGTWDASWTIWPMVVRRPDGQYLLYYTGSINVPGFHQSIGLAIDSGPSLRRVPQQYSTIQSAIDVAAKGDTILVSEGTYYENINFLGKSITVASTYLTTGDTSHISRTIIDGSKPSSPDSGSVVYFVSGEDTNSVLFGFTITGGTGTVGIILDTYGRLGGGVFCKSSGARLTSNIITRNRVIARLAVGGGIAAANFTSTIPFLILERNWIRENFVQGDSAGSGGGYGGGSQIFQTSAKVVNNVFLEDSVFGTNYADGGGMEFSGASATGPFPDANIHGNVFRGNIVRATNKTAFGGGLDIYYTGNTTISDNIFEGNIVTSGLSSAHGGGICIDEDGIQSLTRKMVLRNRFLNNHITGGTIAEGGGIVIGYTLATIGGNEFVGNTVVGGSGGYYAGGGIRCWMSSFRIENNTITGNSAPNGGGIEVANPPYKGSEQVIINNTIYDNNASIGGGIHLASGTNAVLMNNIFWADTAATGKEINISQSTVYVNYNNIQNGWSWGTGNVNADPCFVLPRVDSLHTNSACIAAARDSMTIAGTLIVAPTSDIHGHSRPQPSGSQPDIGAEESPLQVAVGVTQERQEIPAFFALSQNYPNPFNPSTTIEYQIPKQSLVTLRIFDLLGREVATLVNEVKQAGSSTINWDASRLSSGVYFYTITAGAFRETKRMILMK